MERATADNLSAAIREHVESRLDRLQDDFLAYRRMPKIYTHKSVKHGRKEYQQEAFAPLSGRVRSPLQIHRKTTYGERTVAALRLAEGKRLTLKPLKNGVENRSE